VAACYWIGVVRREPAVSRDSAARDLVSDSYQRLRHALGLLLIFPRQPEQEPSLLARVAERR